MKKLTFLALCLPLASVWAQVTNQVNPKSWSQSQVNHPQIVEMPIVNLDALRAEDELQKTQNIQKPYRFGYGFETSLGFENGIWTELPNGDRIWQIEIHSQDAISMNFILENLHLPNGAELFVFNSDRSEKLGPFTQEILNDSNVLTTWPLPGQSMILELFEPKQVKNQSQLQISKVVHGYRQKEAKSPGDSGPCNFDVDCELGDPLDIQKKSIVQILGSGGIEWCSGTMLNNTAEDKTPYIMTANHCFSNPVGSNANLAFRFNWKAAEPECPGNSIIEAEGTLQTAYGASVVAKNAQSDFFLMKINTAIPEDWDVVFAGWNRSADVPEGPSFCLSHPSGDLMKIAFNDDPLVGNGTNMGQHFWEVTEWELGMTEGGSSGSGLFNASGDFIGNLYGGWAACSGSTGNGQWDAYGKLSSSWTGSSTTNRVSDWLDPLNLGVTQLDYLPNINNMGVSTFDSKSFKVYPNPSSGSMTIELAEAKSGNYQLVDITGKIVQKGNLNSAKQFVHFSQLPKGIYILQVKEANSTKAQSQKIIIK
jgi:lysyl endopeptidase